MCRTPLDVQGSSTYGGLLVQVKDYEENWRIKSDKKGIGTRRTQGISIGYNADMLISVYGTVMKARTEVLT